MTIKVGNMYYDTNKGSANRHLLLHSWASTLFHRCTNQRPRLLGWCNDDCDMLYSMDPYVKLYYVQRIWYYMSGDSAKRLVFDSHTVFILSRQCTDLPLKTKTLISQTALRKLKKCKQKKFMNLQITNYSKNSINI